MARISQRIVVLAVLSLPHAAPVVIAQVAPLPAPVSNNAVAIVKSGKHEGIYSFMGIGAKKTWDSITNAAFVMDTSTGKWTELRSVPGPAGRIGASAIGARGQVLLLGGYTVDGQGGEITVADFSVFEPVGHKWFRGTDLPIAVHDAVVGIYRDRYLYVIGGGSKQDAISTVQVYDIEKNKWQEATPTPGVPVSGHAGGLVDDAIVYVDGVHKNAAGTRSYVTSDECWMGKIDHKDITKIQWTQLPEHPGTARYRIGAGASEKEHKIYFSGGSDTAYDYNGIGYDGHAAEPSPVTFAFDVRSGKWETISEDTPDPVMDVRGLVIAQGRIVLVGGMEKGQRVSAEVRVVSHK